MAKHTHEHTHERAHEKTHEEATAPTAKDTSPATTKREPRFKVGDAVQLRHPVVGQRNGVVAEVSAHDAGWLAGSEQLYSVRCQAPPGSDHDEDVFGGVPESCLTLSSDKEKKT